MPKQSSKRLTTARFGRPSNSPPTPVRSYSNTTAIPPFVYTSSRRLVHTSVRLTECWFVCLCVKFSMLTAPRPPITTHAMFVHSNITLDRKTFFNCTFSFIFQCFWFGCCVCALTFALFEFIVRFCSLCFGAFYLLQLRSGRQRTLTRVEVLRCVCPYNMVHTTAFPSTASAIAMLINGLHAKILQIVDSQRIVGIQGDH